MAVKTYTSGDYATSNQYIKMRFQVVVNSQSTANNNSSVTLRLYFRRTNQGYETYGTGTATGGINGTAYTQNITPSQKILYSAGYGICLFERTITIPHNADGSKSLSVTGKISIPGANLSSNTHTYTVALPTIPRASSITSAANVTMGNACSIKWTPASSSFTYTLKFVCGNGSYTTAKISPATAAAYTYTGYSFPTATWGPYITNAVSASVTATLTTYSGSTTVGTSTKSFTLTVPASAVPTMTSFTAERIDGSVPSEWGIYVKGKSKAKLDITGTAGVYGSTVKSCSISGGGYSSSAASYTTGFLNTAGTNTFIGKVTDSRGRIGTKSVSITVEDYSSPGIKSAAAARCSGSGALQNGGTYVLIKPVFSHTSLGGKNTLSHTYRYRRVGESTWTNVGYTSVSGGGEIIGGGNISPDYSYEIELKASDALESVTRILTVSTAKVIMDYKKNGNGMAIGKVSEKDGLEVAWPSTFNSNTVFNDFVDVWLPEGHVSGVRHNKYYNNQRYMLYESLEGTTAPIGGIKLADPNYKVLNYITFANDATNIGQPLFANISSPSVAGVNIIKTAANGTKSRTFLGMEHDSSGKIVNSLIGFLNADGTSRNALYLTDNGTSLQRPLTLNSGGTGATTAETARANLGMMKLIWDGNWTSGNITVASLLSYTGYLLRIKQNGNDTMHSLIVFRRGGAIRGLGGSDDNGSQFILTFQCSVSNTTLSGFTCKGMGHKASGNHGGSTLYTVCQVYGLF